MNESPFSPRQEKFFKTQLVDINMVWGSSGSGKTFMVNIFVYGFILSMLRPGSLALFSGVTTESLYDNVIRQIIEMDRGIGWVDYVASKGGQRLIFKNNVEVACVGAMTERAQDRIQGKSVALWYADEITKQPKSFVEMALGRCRTVIDQKMVVSPALWTMNADHPGHYVKRDYLDKADGKEMREWMFTLEDNPTATPEYIEKQKRRYSGVYYSRMIENKWVISEGAVYETFNRGEHVVPGVPMPKIRRWVLGIDWGYEHPLSILLVGVDSDGCYYVADEIHERHRLIDPSLASDIKSKWGELKIEIAYCDDARPEYIDQFERLTGIRSIGANKEVHEGIQSVQKLLKKRGDDSFGLYVNSKCVNTITEFETYSWLSGKTGAKDEPAKVNDHAMDALRYVAHTDTAMNERYDILRNARIVVR